MKDLDEIFREHGLPRGRCFGSKSSYRNRNRHSIFISNACVCTSESRIWGGDLDLCTQDASCLMLVARILGEALYVLSERSNELSHAEILKYSEFVVTDATIVITELGWTYVPKAPDGATIVARRE